MKKYTCSMHPEVISYKSGKCPKCGMNLVEINTASQDAKHDHPVSMTDQGMAKEFLKRFIIVTLILIPLALLSNLAVEYLKVPDFEFRKYIEFILASFIFYFGLIFFKHAQMEIKMKQYGMMTLVSLGTGSGYLFSAISTFIPTINAEFYLEIATLIWILLFGHFLEARSSGVAGDALSEVAKLLPKNAHLKIKGGTKEVKLAFLKRNDVVLVKPGEKVPADGKIVSGNSNFNEAHITGESLPVHASEGTEVPAGAICIGGSVEVKLLRVGKSSTIGQIEKLISTAQLTKPSVQKLADKAARWLTFSALTISVITILYWSLIALRPFEFAVTLAITVLVIACPHALGLAIPTVSTIATKLAVNNGLFIKDMGKIEVVRAADYVVFDKTGTLTEGNFVVTDFGSKEILRLAAAVEQNSEHPIAAAIVEAAHKQKIKIPKVVNFRSFSGSGVKGNVGRLEIEVKRPGVTVYKNGKVIGKINVEDVIRKESKNSIEQLHKLGLKVAMLTGDKKETAKKVASELRIDSVFSEVLPQDKYKYIKELQNQGNVVIMAGDGVNDAPALTQSDVGVAIGTGTDLAVEAGDIVLTQSNPRSLVKLIVLSKKVYGKMLENLFWAAGYNIVALPAAAGVFFSFGFLLTPAIGAILMSISSVIVVVNALSLRSTSLAV